MDGDLEYFEQTNSEYAQDLSSNSMGKLLLGKVAAIYAEQAY